MLSSLSKGHILLDAHITPEKEVDVCIKKKNTVLPLIRLMIVPCSAVTSRFPLRSDTPGKRYFTDPALA